MPACDAALKPYELFDESLSTGVKFPSFTALGCNLNVLSFALLFRVGLGDIPNLCADAEAEGGLAEF